MNHLVDRRDEAGKSNAHGYPDTVNAMRLLLEAVSEDARESHPAQ